MTRPRILHEWSSPPLPRPERREAWRKRPTLDDIKRAYAIADEKGIPLRDALVIEGVLRIKR